MAWRLAESLDQLRDQINTAWPGRSKTSDGTIGDAAHATRASDHNPDENGVVRAIDLTEDLTVGLSMNAVAEEIRLSRDPRVKYVIHEGRMFSSYATSTRKAWEWGPYSGTNSHKTHMHVSTVSTPTLYDDRRPWQIGEEPTMFVARGSKGPQVEYWQRRLLRINPTILPRFGADGDYGGETVTAVAAICGTDGAKIGPVEADVIEARAATGGGVSEQRVAALVAAHAKLPGDANGVHMHKHDVVITQDITGTAV